MDDHIVAAPHCVFSFFNPDTYTVRDSPYTAFCVVRGEAPLSIIAPTPAPIDCSSTSNCIPQLSFCGGTLPDENFDKQSLLSCIPKASKFVFESKNFTRKAHITNDFFYNEAEKTFMNGCLLS